LRKHYKTGEKMSKRPLWEVVDVTSSSMPSMYRVIGRFETLAGAETLSKSDDRFRIRQEPEKRSKNEDEEIDE